MRTTYTLNMHATSIALACVLSLSISADTAKAGADCVPSGAGFGCQDVTCTGGGNTCTTKCIRYDPFSGVYTVLECQCDNATACQAERPPVLVAPACVVAEDGTGTVHLPPAPCSYKTDTSGPMKIIDGLPIGSMINCAATYSGFACTPLVPVCSFLTPVLPGICYAPGGALGGEKSCATANLNFIMQGTGAFAAYNRNLNIPISLEINAAPRTPGNPIQTFDTDMFRLFGQIIGDPDFDLLRVVGGTDFGLPSPGKAQLIQLPGGSWAVYNVFSLTYRIDFVGKIGGPFTGLSGSTTGTVNIATGGVPLCNNGCFPGFECSQNILVNANGTIDVCCDCVSIPCEPLPDGSACRADTCGVSNCQPRCVETNPASGQSTIIACECGDQETCEVNAAPITNPCVVFDSGNGTVHLPPTGCQYKRISNPPMQIIDGLPVGSPVTCEPTRFNFSCGAGGGVCSFFVPVSPGICYAPGGSLGGEKSCAGSTLNLVMSGAGVYLGYNRNLNVPINIEIHAAPRTLFAPTQTFNTDMFRLFGQITGDPDFDLLRFVGGTDFGLPSPGSTTLLQMPSTDWAVDSFFDLTYRIDFVGNPGGPFAGRSGSTTGTIRIATGQAPSCSGNCPPGYRCDRSMVLTEIGTIITCCDCVTVCDCRGDMNGDGKVNGSDIKLFINCLLSYAGGFIDETCVCADMNIDGALTTDGDITPFVNKLLTLPNNLCP